MLSNTKDKRQNLNLNFSLQNAADKQGDVTQNTGSQFYNVNAGYSLNLVPRNITFTLALNGNINDSPGFQSKTFGPTAAINKTFLDRKLRTSLSSSYNNAYMNSRKTSSILNLRLNGSYTVQKKHNVNLSIAAVNRTTNSETSAKSFTEYTGTLGYSYAFGGK